MARREYYDRAVGAIVRDRTPYKKPRKHVKKPKYQSKEYREYNEYIHFKHKVTIGTLMAEYVHYQAQRPGFMRRILAAQEGITLPEPKHSEQYEAYQRDVREYSKWGRYPVPEGWKLQRAEQELLSKKDTSEMIDMLKQAFN
jgi:hypothetical protein